MKTDRSLFAPAPRRQRGLILTLTGSLLFHGSLIGVAALWPTHPKDPVPYGPTEIYACPLPPESPSIPWTPPDAAEPVPPVLQAPEPVADQPPTPDPDAVDMVLSTPAPRPAVATRTPARTGSVPTVAHVSPSRTATGPAAAASGTGAVVAHPGVRWNVPKPAYPASLRLARVQGSGSVRITTDAAGRIVNAVIVQSTGSAVLDDQTCQTAKTRWSGPPNATTMVPITYRLE